MNLSLAVSHMPLSCWTLPQLFFHSQITQLIVGDTGPFPAVN
jgi:hypothetical protein